MRSLNCYPTRIEKVKSESKGGHEKRCTLQSLDNIENKRERGNVKHQTHSNLRESKEFEELSNSKCNSYNGFDDIDGEIGSPTMYTFKETLLLPMLPPEAMGMMRIFKNTTKAERLLKRLPSMSSFSDSVPTQQSPEDLRDTLIFSFYKLMRKNLSKPAYCYMLSHKEDLIENLIVFSKAGDYKALLKKIEDQCQLADFVKLINV